MADNVNTAAVDTHDPDDNQNTQETVPSIPLDPLAGEDGGEEGRRLCAFWKDQIEDVDEEQKRWIKRGRTIEKRYRDERNRTDEEGQRRYNCLWSNTEIMLPALYGKPPVPIAERRFRDKDPIGRAAAQMLERGLRNELEICGLHDAVEGAVKDYLLPGRGVVWVRYEPEMSRGFSIPVESELDLRDAQGQIEDDLDDPTQIKLQETSERVVRESVPVDYISWVDFYAFPAKSRFWKEVVAVGKRCYMTRDQMIDRFGRKIGKAVPLQRDSRDKKNQVGESPKKEDPTTQKAEVYEIWSMSDRRIYWVAEGYEFLLDRKDDPLQLMKFFPVPEPLNANPTRNTLIPVPDFIEYQDQAIQIDELTQRIAMLVKACKVAGLYDAANKDIMRLLDESVENELIPVDGWAAFAEKGGVAGAMSLLPLKDIIGVINELTMVRKGVIEDMDRLTGITDIMRGTTDARETMGAQRLKTNGSGTRLQNRQQRIAVFCRDTIRMQAEIMAKHFSPRSLIEASGAMYEEGLGADKTMVPVTPEVMDAVMNGGPLPDITPPNPIAQAVATRPPQAPPQLPAPGPAPVGAAGPLGAAPPPGLGAPPMGSPGAPPPMNGPAGPMPLGASPQGVGAGVPPAPPPLLPGGGPGAAPPMMPGVPPAPPMIPGAPPPPPPMMMPRGLLRIMAAFVLLRNDKLRGFRVDIETDSTIYGDQQQEKADRNEFLGSVTKFLQVSAQIGQQMPDIIPLLGKFLQFGVRGYRVGRDLESAIDDFCEQADNAAVKRAGQPPPPTPEQMKAQADQAKAQADAEKTKADVAATQQKMTQEAQAHELEMQSNVSQQQVEQMKAQTDAKQAEADVQSAQIQAKSEEMQAQAEVARQQIENQGEAANQAADERMKMMEMQLEEQKIAIEKLHLALDAKKIEAETKQLNVQAKLDTKQMKVDEKKIEAEKHKATMAKEAAGKTAKAK